MASDGRVAAAIIGPGNIGTDLMYKIGRRSRHLRLALMAGIDPKSPGLARAEALGVAASSNGVEAVLAREEVRIVFDATSAAAHLVHAPLLAAAGRTVVDLTPAAVGPFVCPAVNLETHLDEPNLNLITCGGQATIPIVAAVSRVVRVPYAEVVCVISSLSAGPGTRANIDEFTRTTADGVVRVGGAETAKAIILLNPADPPLVMNNTIYLRVEEYAEREIDESVRRMVAGVQRYVPGYRLKIPPSYDGERVIVMIEVEGAGDFLPSYSGNLDIETSAAVAVGDRIAAHLLSVPGGAS